MFARTALAALVLFLAPPAAATTVVFLSRAELAAKADAVVRARVLSRESLRSPTSGRILTRSRLEVLAAYKGAPPKVLELEQLGGALGGERLEVHGDASLKVGEEAVFFLRCFSPERCHLFGLALGKYAVQRDEKGRATAVRDLSRLRGEHGALSREAPVPLEQLERELRSKP